MVIDGQVTFSCVGVQQESSGWHAPALCHKASLTSIARRDYWLVYSARVQPRRTMLPVFVAFVILHGGRASPVSSVMGGANVVSFPSAGYDVGECTGRGDSIRCVGLGPGTADPLAWVDHLELSTWMWTPTKQIVLSWLPNLQVHQQINILSMSHKTTWIFSQHQNKLLRSNFTFRSVKVLISFHPKVQFTSHQQ
jgi:hypothetical protein